METAYIKCLLAVALAFYLWLYLYNLIKWEALLDVTLRGIKDTIITAFCLFALPFCIITMSSDKLHLVDKVNDENPLGIFIGAMLAGLFYVVAPVACLVGLLYLS